MSDQSTPLGPQLKGTDREFSITLGGGGYGEDGTPIPGAFDGSETFTATLGAGVGYAPLATLAATWNATIPGNPASVDHPTLTLTSSATAITIVPPGTWAVQILSSTGLEIWSGSLEVVEGSGTRALPVIYHQPADLKAEMSSVAGLASLASGVASNFLGQAQGAALYIRRQLRSRYDTGLRENMRLWGTPCMPSDAPLIGVDYSCPDKTIRDLLALFDAALLAGGLVADEQLTRISVLYTLHLVCRTQVGREPGDTPWQTLAKTFLRDAKAAMTAWSGWVDLDADGVGDVFLSY